jgi:hypothetical protein
LRRAEFFSFESGDSILKADGIANLSTGVKRMPLGRKYTSDEMKNLLGAPPLIRGESEKAYWIWWYQFVDAHKPLYLQDWLDVNQLAAKHWEQERLRRCNAALVDGALIEALTNLLRPLRSEVLHGHKILQIHKIAHDYYYGIENDKREAAVELETHGITEEQILAEAMQIRAPALVMYDRLDNYRTNSKRSLQKDLDRRSETRSNGLD